MSNHKFNKQFYGNKILFLTVIFSLMLFPGCYSSMTTYERLPLEDEVTADPYGAFLHLEVKVGNKAINSNYNNFYSENDYYEINGEFIGIDTDRVFIMDSKGKLNSYNFKNIMFADIELIDHATGKYVLWTTVGTLSTISTGFLMFGLAPLWLISGISTTASISRLDKYRTDMPRKDWWQKNLKYARFPQGLPDDIKNNKNKLKAKPDETE
jgi:hypothetical protein